MEFSGDDPTLDGVLACVCAQIQISYAIIATTTPCLRPFMSALNTHYGGPTETRTPAGSKSGSKVSKTVKSENSYSMATFPSRGNSDRIEPMPLAENPKSESQGIGVAVTGRWEQADRIERASSDHISDHRSMQSNDSQRMIITRAEERQLDGIFQGTQAR